MTLRIKMTDEFGKIKKVRDPKRDKNIPEHEREHPVHQPYHRTNKGTLRHSLVTNDIDPEDSDDDTTG